MGFDARHAPARLGRLSGSAGRPTGSILAQLDGATTSPGGTVAVARWIVSGVKLLEPQSQGCGGRLCGRGRISHVLGQPQACTPSRARTAAVRPSKALWRHLRQRDRSSGSVGRSGCSGARCVQGRRPQLQPRGGLGVPASVDAGSTATAPDASTCASGKRTGSELQPQVSRGACQCVERAWWLWLGLWRALEGAAGLRRHGVNGVMHAPNAGLTAAGELLSATGGYGASRPSGPTVPQREPAQARLSARR